jgi:hypothetical protein
LSLPGKREVVVEHLDSVVSQALDGIEAEQNCGLEVANTRNYGRRVLRAIAILAATQLRHDRAPLPSAAIAEAL